jgi:site-specific recombinase XerD
LRSAPAAAGVWAITEWFQSERGGAMTPKSFHALFGRIDVWAKMPFPVYPHMLRHGCGYALANGGHDTRALQAWLGHRNIQLRPVNPSGP